MRAGMGIGIVWVLGAVGTARTLVETMSMLALVVAVAVVMGDIGDGLE